MDETEKTVKAEEEPKKKLLARIVGKVKEVGGTIAAVLVTNPMLIVPLVAGIVNLSTKTTGLITGTTRNEKYMASDDVTGEKLSLKHSLTNAEILELGERMNGGSSKAEALDDMGLLRNEKRRK